MCIFLQFVILENTLIFSFMSGDDEKSVVLDGKTLERN